MARLSHFVQMRPRKRRPSYSRLRQFSKTGVPKVIRISSLLNEHIQSTRASPPPRKGGIPLEATWGAHVDVEILEMAEIRIKLEFQSDAADIKSYEKQITAPARSSDRSIERQALQTFADLEKDLILATFFDALPEPEGLFESGSQRFSSDELFNDSYFNQVNVQTLWFEIQKTLISIRFLLSAARSYKTLEPAHNDDFSKNGFLYLLHFSKMEQFDLATFNLAKVEDLVGRLLFEATSAKFVNTGAPDWERKLTWDRVKDALKDRNNNTALASMDDPEYNSLMQLFLAFRNPSFVKTFVEYRDRVAHRISPSVDFPELYSAVEDRMWKEVRGPMGNVVRRVKGFGTGRKAEFQFLELYEVAKKSFEHYLALLKQLRGISLLNPPVSPSA